LLKILFVNWNRAFLFRRRLPPLHGQCYDLTLPCRSKTPITAGRHSLAHKREEQNRCAGKARKLFCSSAAGGAEPTEISLNLAAENLAAQIAGLDGFVLPGSPADVEPSRYGAARHEKTKTLDPARDRTDSAILDHAIAERKPVLAICYGCQILNVHQRGTLVQDISAERPGNEAHGNTDLAAGVKKVTRSMTRRLRWEGRLAKLAGAERVHINKQPSPVD